MNATGFVHTNKDGGNGPTGLVDNFILIVMCQKWRETSCKDGKIPTLLIWALHGQLFPLPNCYNMRHDASNQTEKLQVLHPERCSFSDKWMTRSKSIHRRRPVQVVCASCFFSHRFSTPLPSTTAGPIGTKPAADPGPSKISHWEKLGANHLKRISSWLMIHGC